MKMVKIALSEDQNCTLDFYFGGHLRIFRAEILHKSELFKDENNSQSTFKQLLNNFQKAQKTGFLSLQILKMILTKS